MLSLWHDCSVCEGAGGCARAVRVEVVVAWFAVSQHGDDKHGQRRKR